MMGELTGTQIPGTASLCGCQQCRAQLGEGSTPPGHERYRKEASGTPEDSPLPSPLSDGNALPRLTSLTCCPWGAE